MHPSAHTHPFETGAPAGDATVGLAGGTTNDDPIVAGGARAGAGAGAGAGINGLVEDH